MVRKRLDYAVAKKLGVSRSAAANLIKAGKVKVSGLLKMKSATKIDDDNTIRVEQSAKPKKKPLKLKVLYEDSDCIVIDKPAGVLAHSKGGYNEEATVASWLSAKVRGFEKNNNRAGIIHRLDRGTSGVMICAKNPEALAYFQKQFSLRKVNKKYHALIQGQLDLREAIIDIPIERNPKDPKRFRAHSNGKSAQTFYKTIKVFSRNNTEYSLLELSPKTGRTHQLRVHLSYMKHPIVGDEFYGDLKANRLYLHASSLSLKTLDNQNRIFTSGLPKVFSNPKILDNE